MLGTGVTSSRYMYKNIESYLFSLNNFIFSHYTIIGFLFSSLVLAGSRVKVIAGTAANQTSFLISKIKGYLLHTKSYFCSSMILGVITPNGVFLSRHSIMTSCSLLDSYISSSCISGSSIDCGHCTLSFT